MVDDVMDQLAADGVVYSPRENIINPKCTISHCFGVYFMTFNFHSPEQVR